MLPFAGTAAVKRLFVDTLHAGGARASHGKVHAKPVDKAAMEMLPPVPVIHWRADCVCLFQSILRPEGPQYRRLEIFKLKRS